MAGGSSGNLPAGAHGSVLSCSGFRGSANLSQIAVPPLLSLRRALLPHIQAAAERLVLLGPLGDLAAQPHTESQHFCSQASAPSCATARESLPQKPAEPREPPPWKTRSPGAGGAGGPVAIEGGTMSRLSSSEDSVPNLLSPCTLPASATLSISPPAASGGLSVSPKLHTSSLGASGAGSAGGGADGGESLELQHAPCLHALPARPQALPEIAWKQDVHESYPRQESSRPPAAATKGGHGVLQTHDAWGDSHDGGAHVRAAGSAWEMEVQEEEWGDFDEGVDETLAFPTGARPLFLLSYF